MHKEHLDNETKIIFLAILWAGGGPYSVSQIIHAYDWINRAIPSREEMEYAINFLLSNNLIKADHDKYYITKDVGNEFEAYRKKAKKGKFKVVKMYFDKIKPHDIDEMRIKISESEYKSALKKYSEFMQS